MKILHSNAENDLVLGANLYLCITELSREERYEFFNQALALAAIYHDSISFAVSILSPETFKELRKIHQEQLKNWTVDLDDNK